MPTKIFCREHFGRRDVLNGGKTNFSFLLCMLNNVKPEYNSTFFNLSEAMVRKFNQCTKFMTSNKLISRQGGYFECLVKLNYR